MAGQWILEVTGQELCLLCLQELHTGKPTPRSPALLPQARSWRTGEQLQVPPARERRCCFKWHFNQPRGEGIWEPHTPPGHLSCPERKVFPGKAQSWGRGLRHDTEALQGRSPQLAQKSYFRSQPKSATANYAANRGEGTGSARHPTPELPRRDGLCDPRGASGAHGAGDASWGQGGR